MNELPIPPAAKRDEESIELIRAFVAEGDQWTSINTELFKDREFLEEEAWGIFIADTIKHVANAITLHSGKDQYDITCDIFEALSHELDNSTSIVSGG